jgi:hypothetical protein
MRVFHPSRAAALLGSIVALAAFSGRADAQGRAIAGTYNTVINSPQGSVKAVIVLKKEAASFTGTLAAEGFPTLPVSNVVASDTGVTMMGDSPDGGVAVSIRFRDADKVTGTVLYQGAEMTLEGTFAAGGAIPAGGAMSPVGDYELKAQQPIMGQADFPLQCKVSKGADGTFSGSCGNEMGAAALSSVVVAGNVVTLSGDSPAGPFKLVVTVAGADASGDMTLGTETAKIKGRFTAK